LLKPCFPKQLGSPSVGAREDALRRDLDAMDEARRREMAKRKRRRNNAVTIAGDPRCT
jgi:hypothetical protein